MERQHKTCRRPVPGYALFPLLFAAAFNVLVYSGSKLVSAGWHHYNPTTVLDGYIPFIPQFLVIYLGCYLFWIINYILIACQKKEDCYRFFTADFLSRVFCLVFFLAFPTTNQRPVLPDTGFWNQAVRLLYAADTPVNLFPSIHCLVSWFCYIGIRKNPRIPLWYRRTSCVMAILVFISTLVTRQHVIVDVAGAVILAELSLRLGRIPALWKAYGRIFDRAWLLAVRFTCRKKYIFRHTRSKKQPTACAQHKKQRSTYHEA